jgi:RNA polymerase sigma-70 factor (ECF subfamily)
MAGGDVLPVDVQPVAETSDEELVRESRSGDTRAFGTLVDRHHRRIIGIAAHMMGDYQLGEDAAQEAFVRAYRSLDRLQEPKRFGSWVAAIAGHVALDWLRARKARPVEQALPPAEFLPGLPDRLEPPDAPEVLAAVRAAVLALPEELRTPLALRAQAGLSYAAIAAALELNESQVKGRIHRARQVLRTALGRRVLAGTGAISRAGSGG